MLCQHCNKEQATRHYKQVINGETREAHLCTNCASQLGYDSIFSWGTEPFGFGLDSLLSNMVGQTKSVKPRSAVSCSLCGATAEDISRTGRVGCAECYHIFADMLHPYITRIHGNTKHAGRVPDGAGGQLKLRRKVDSLRADLQKAIDSQEFERAAELRDEIRNLEGELGND